MVQEQERKERADRSHSEQDERDDRATRTDLQEPPPPEWPAIAVRSCAGGARLELVDKFGRRCLVTEIRAGWTTPALLTLIAAGFALGLFLGKLA